MRNRDLKDFKECLHSSLKVVQKGEYFCVKEQENTSKIKEIKFKFTQKDDVLIIQQDIQNCNPIENLFGNDKDRIESCDFIVLLTKSKELKIFFCEIKSNISEESIEKAKRQIKSSKIFFEYLYKSYLHKYDKDIDFNQAVENAKHVLFYPAGMLQKSSTSSTNSNLIQHKIELDDNGICNIDDGYDFFKSKHQ